jgi:hypothetical protein
MSILDIFQRIAISRPLPVQIQFPPVFFRPRPNHRKISASYIAISRDDGTVRQGKLEIEIRADGVDVRNAVILIIEAYLD